MRAFIPYVLISVFLLGYLKTEGKHVQFLCGFSLQLYNPDDEECINGHVLRKTTASAPNQASFSPNRLLCGSNLQLYNPVTHVCIDGHVFERTATPALKKISTSPNSTSINRKPTATPEQALSRILLRNCRCCDLDVTESGSSNTKCHHLPPTGHGYTVRTELSVISLITGLPVVFYRILK